MGLGKKVLMFTLGGLGYVGVELLWRGHSHYSMFLAGGTCFLLLGQLGKRTRSNLTHALGGACIITAVELITGLLANRDYSVWDYRQLPFQFMGQICLMYSLLWIPLSLAGVTLYRLLDSRLNFSR